MILFAADSAYSAFKGIINNNIFIENIARVNISENILKTLNNEGMKQTFDVLEVEGFPPFVFGEQALRLSGNPNVRLNYTVNKNTIIDEINQILPAAFARHLPNGTYEASGVLAVTQDQIVIGKEIIQQNLIKKHKVKVYKKGGETFSHTVNINIQKLKLIEQPIPALLAWLKKKYNSIINHPHQNSNIVIVDAGGVTLDLLHVNNMSIINYETHPDLGFRRVIKITTDNIFYEYKTRIHPAVFEHHFINSTPLYIHGKKASIKNLLRPNINFVAEDIKVKTNEFLSYAQPDFCLLTGRASQSWFPYLKSLPYKMELMSPELLTLGNALGSFILAQHYFEQGIK